MTGLALTAILILGATITAAIGPLAFRFFFWIALGLAASTFAVWGITSIVAIIAVLVALNFFVTGGRDTLRVMRASLIDGARQALPVGLACAIVGVVIGVLTLTGAASTFAGFILQVGSTSLLLSLALTMVVCLVLGMGIPTIPNYIITSSIAAPALLQLGVPLIVSHMFVFYFGIMADLTPPVALAALAASSIAKESYIKIGFKATQIAIAGFVVPYMAVYDPALMLLGSWPDAIYMIGKALLAIGLWGAAAVGYLRSPLGRVERVAAVVAACLLVAAVPVTDTIGFVMAAAFGAYHAATTRARRVSA
jgi:TRAP transporter 4TM/12TM fusion protein